MIPSMKTSYSAILRGHTLTWIDSPPLTKQAAVQVEVVLQSSELSAAHPVDFLAEIAARGGIADIPDPVAWQREQRADRPIAGREG